MADYEVLLKQMQTLDKELRDKLASSNKSFKSMNKSLESGDIKTWTRDLGVYRSLLQEQDAILQSLQGLVAEFGVRAYLEGGEYVEQMLTYCEQQGVDVKGDAPVFEMFPFKVRLDMENLDVYLDRKRVQCMRPLALVQVVKKNRDRLLKSSFDARGFIKALATAYDLVLLKQNDGKRARLVDADVMLKTLYAMLTPMSRQKRDYDQQNFAFDLARLYASEIRSTEDGRMFQFGPSRNFRQAIRILDQKGREQFLATIRFYQPTLIDGLILEHDSDV